MGIKHLWTILAPFCERKPLYELQGKTVAVDLSCWICEAQNIAEYQVQPRMYLRNLYFRTCYLLLMEVNPVFILEGKAPELKFDTIAARNALQFKGAKPKTDGVKTGKDRSRFNHVLKRCEEMLRYMGLSCLKGKGEAECLCAYLNDEGLVDGCISQDSDCFAYGAKIVYRNFSIASQGAYAASGGAVDIYDISKIKNAMNFGRNKIVAMALLCGCDYYDGVMGVGKESALKLFDTLQDEETLEILRSWRNQTEKYNKLEKMINDKNICTTCGHNGKVQGHNKNGCGPCGMIKGCNNATFKEERLKIKNELAMRSRALQDPNFPNEELIQEFLTKKDKVSKIDLKWRQPELTKFVQFTTKFLDWEELYAFEKFLPILTRWQCLNPEALKSENLTGVVQPSHILKVRKPKGIPSYEIVWEDPGEYFKNLIPKEQIEESKETPEKLWSTIEPQNLVDKAYPKLVEVYQQSKSKPKKATRRKKKDAGVEEIEDMLKNTSITEPKPKRTRKTTKKKEAPKQQAVLDNFLKQALLNTQKNKNLELEDSLNKEIDDIIDIDTQNCFTSTPSKSTEAIPMDISRFGDEEDDDDLSLIIKDIISRKPPNLEEALKKIDVRTLFKDSDEKMDQSSFFITGPVENDLFEESFHNIKSSDANDDTEEYEYDDNIEMEKLVHKENEDVHNEPSNETKDDSFCDIYVPLMDRLKKK